jgi:electron transport complex protein RnfC
MNVTSIATLNRFIKTGMPLVSKRVTVDGNAVKDPKNVIVPIGTSIKELLDFVGVQDDDANEIIMGGPMMGMDVVSADSAVEKRNNAITVMKPDKIKEKVTPCIRCGRCVNACPMNLYPASIETAVRFDNLEKIAALNAEYCMECGSCSFVCPAKRPLTQTIRLGKAKLKAVKK